MSLQQIKNMKDQKGFTIVELLIVIVVIGILAAIIIVAYQGVAARANTTKAKTLASTVQKKAEAYAADTSTGGGNGSYPTTAAQFSGDLAGLPAGTSILTGTGATLSASTTQVKYQVCNSGGGYKITWWDYSKSGGAGESTDSLVGGNTTGTCDTPPAS